MSFCFNTSQQFFLYLPALLFFLSSLDSLWTFKYTHTHKQASSIASVSLKLCFFLSLPATVCMHPCLLGYATTMHNIHIKPPHCRVWGRESILYMHTHFSKNKKKRENILMHAMRYPKSIYKHIEQNINYHVVQL